MIMPEAEDRYYTISKPSKGIYKEKGSKFISFACPVENESDIDAILMRLGKEYHDASHMCFAWVLGHDGEFFRTNDDGEPANSAGKPILMQIRSRKLTNILVVVVRYFGGTLLGVGGLIRAYKSAGYEALDHARTVARTVTVPYRLIFDYSETQKVMKIIKQNKIEQVSQQFDLKCKMVIAIRKSKNRQLVEVFRRIPNVDIQSVEHNKNKL